ncbi:hypothetical protein [Ichthyenterobacterium magnum]|uniref:Outer membrane protein with beta-barrel domain n=1 Tax=Ichthyenterobacterium magnum TaxID=1230530 RepID=A0A420DXD7_9FLAO|nr:hypothetical protein [Ichthyenterobacterium magnum]RKE98885.1 hypothetical protein BXY80_0980 [Ichthyenterobacterium magnum]
MSDKKHIDRLFQEKLKNFEASPNDAVWDNIEKELHKDKRKRRVIPIWWKLAGVAAILALLFTVGSTFFNDSSNNTIQTNPIVNTENSNLDTQISNTDNVKNPSEELNLKIVTKENNAINSNKTEANSLKLTSNTSEKHNNEIANKSSNTKTNNQNTDAIIKNLYAKSQHYKNETTTDKTKISVVKNTSNLPKPNITLKSKSEIDALINKEQIHEKSTITAIAKNEENLEEEENLILEEKLEDLKKETSIEDAIANANEKEEDENEEKLKRWSVSPNVAPVYFNSLGKGSSIDQQFVDNSKNGEINMSYGVGGSYAINKKLKVRAGINKVALGYNTNDVIVYNSTNASFVGNSSFEGNTQLRNIKFNGNTQSTNILSSESISFIALPQVLAENVKSSLDQRIGFIEIPVEVEYNIINKKIDLNVIGGFSTLFLDKNEVYSNVNGNSTLIGEATNINSTSYSANFGIGVNYNVSEKLKVNLEPMFKYQINTFNNSSGDFQPYFIGVYTGLSFKF